MKKIVFQTKLIKASRWNVSLVHQVTSYLSENLVTLQVTALLFIKGRSDMQMKLGTLFACRSFCFATSWRQSDLQCTMFYCMRREIFSDQFFGWIMVKGPDIKCIKNLGSCLKSNGGPRPWFVPPKLRNEICRQNIIQHLTTATTCNNYTSYHFLNYF